MKRAAKDLLRCLHEGYIVQRYFPHQIGRHDPEGGVWRPARFSYDNTVVPRFLVDLVDEHPDRLVFREGRGCELIDDGLMTEIDDFTFMHCLTPKGKALAEGLFGPLSSTLFVREPEQVPALTDREVEILTQLIEFKIDEADAVTSLGIDSRVLFALLRTAEQENDMRDQVSAWYRNRPEEGASPKRG